MKKHSMILIVLIALLFLVYCTISVWSFKNQKNVEYLNKNQVIKVFENDLKYFDSLARYYESHEDAIITYDLTNKYFVSSVTEEDADVLKKLVEEYSFNLIMRDDDYFSIMYNRPFDHSVLVGMTYDYATQEWAFTYDHNYDRCAKGHFWGYRFYDLLYN